MHGVIHHVGIVRGYFFCYFLFFLVFELELSI